MHHQRINPGVGGRTIQNTFNKLFAKYKLYSFMLRAIDTNTDVLFTYHITDMRVDIIEFGTILLTHGTSRGKTYIILNQKRK